jgi:hypothetical protein
LLSDPNKYEEGFNLLKLGSVVTLGALAYRSAEQRKFGKVKFAGMRVVLEIAALAVICIIILAQSRLKYEIATEPTANFVAPLWAIVAYLVLILTPGWPTAETAAPKRQEKQRIEKALEEDRASYEALDRRRSTPIVHPTKTEVIVPFTILPFVLLIGWFAYSQSGPQPTLGNALREDAPVASPPTAQSNVTSNELSSPDNGSLLPGLNDLFAPALEIDSSKLQTLTAERYLAQVGLGATLIPHDELTLDGRVVKCGDRPTVLNPNFDGISGAFPVFIILNPSRLNGLSTTVKLFVFSQSCGYQFVGYDPLKADCFAIRRGVKWGWLNARGLEEVCAFISTLRGDAKFPPGPARCEAMRQCFANAQVNSD